MKRSYPWSDLNTPVYEAINVKKRKAWVNVYAWFCVAILIVAAITSKYHIACAVAAFIVASAILVEHLDAVTDRGFETVNDVKYMMGTDLWPWSEIEALTYEKNEMAPDVTLLFFTRGARTKRAFFSDEDAVKIRVLAKKKNKSIKIYDGNEYREQEREYLKNQKSGRKKKK